METNENITNPKSMGHSKSCSKRKVYSNTSLRKQEKSQINNLTPKVTRKRKTKPKFLFLVYQVNFQLPEDRSCV